MTDAERKAWLQQAVAALHDSIAHWERLATGRERDGEEPGPADCECCQRFLSYKDGACLRCPVAIRSGAPGCGATPFVEADDAWEQWMGDGLDVSEQAFRAAAQLELEYLRETLRLVEAEEVRPR